MELLVPIRNTTGYYHWKESHQGSIGDLARTELSLIDILLLWSQLFALKLRSIKIVFSLDVCLKSNCQLIEERLHKQIVQSHKLSFAVAVQRGETNWMFAGRQNIQKKVMVWWFLCKIFFQFSPPFINGWILRSLQHGNCKFDASKPLSTQIF